jgi:hypothetical protein
VSLLSLFGLHEERRYGILESNQIALRGNEQKGSNSKRPTIKSDLWITYKGLAFVKIITKVFLQLRQMQ